MSGLDLSPMLEMTASGESYTPPDPPAFAASLDFSDADNSQYVALLFEDF